MVGLRTEKEMEGGGDEMTVPPPDEFSTLKFEKILFFVPAAVGHLRPAFGGDVVFGGVAEVDVES